MEPVRELELHHSNDRQLMLVNQILRPGCREAGGLSDHRQQLEGNACTAAQLPEGCAAEPGESIERGHVQVGERERAIPDSGSHPV
jgi:hypothetical protein